MSSRLPATFGDYSLLHLLGRGGSGAAYLAVPRDRRKGPSPVVLKLLHPDAAENEVDRARFEHEAKLAQTANLEALAKVYEVGVAAETPYIAMELVRGMSLSKLMASLRSGDGVLSVPEVLKVVGSTLEGLKELHEAKDDDGRELGAIHRDLSPANLMLDERGRVRILDLGVGRSRLREHRTQTGLIIGTPGYMSPEQVLSGEISQRSDVYTIGVILWELVTGRRYVPAGDLASVLTETVKRVYEPPSKFRSWLSPRIDEVCRRALEIEPEKRFASAAEMLDEIDELKAARLDRMTGAHVIPLAEVYALDLPAAELSRLLGTDKEAETVVREPETVVHERATEVREPDTAVKTRVSAMTATPVLPDTELKIINPPRPSRTPLVVTALALAGVALLVAVWLPLRRAPVVQVQLEPAPPQELVQPAPAVQPRPVEPEPVEKKPAVAEPEKGARPAPKKIEQPAAKVVDEAPEPTAEQLIARINALARSIKSARPERAAEVDDLLNAVLFESTAGDTPPVRARLTEIAAALDRLKAK